MKYRFLGGSGLKVSAIGLGTNQFGRKVDIQTTREIIDAALDAGINFIDTADTYGGGLSEQFIGEALAGKRHQALIATKVRHPVGDGPNQGGATRYHILEGVDASLHRLQTDYIDLYQIHSWDPEPPIEETMRALEDLLRWGKVRYIGASNYSAWQLVRSNDLADWRGWTQFVSVQPHYHMFERGIEKELIPACQYFNIGILPYFPLAGGFLTGKYKPGQPPPPGSRGETSQYVQRLMTSQNFDRLEGLTGYAKERGHSMGELAHAWLLAQPQVASVISGATRVEHVRANAASSDWDLSQVEVAEINEILNKE